VIQNFHAKLWEGEAIVDLANRVISYHSVSAELSSSISSGRAGRESKMNQKSAAAYSFADRLVFHCELTTDFGSFAIAPFQRLARDAAQEEIGCCVRVALDGCRTQPGMPNVKESTKSFLAGVGVKSIAQLQRSALYVGILQSDAIEFYPTHNGGTAGDKKGFQPLAGEPLRVSVSASAGEIGDALMRAFSLCTTIYA
jgi:hypothetical protein